MIEPVDPFERGIFDSFEAAPKPAQVDHLGSVEAVDRLGQSVVITVANAANRRLDPGLGKALGVLDRQVLRPRGRCGGSEHHGEPAGGYETPARTHPGQGSHLLSCWPTIRRSGERRCR